MSNLQNLVGQKFGRLTVIRRSENSASGRTRWLCHCSCGTEKAVFATALVRGLTKSCGCLNDETRKTASLKHGLRKHKLYSVWNDMKCRCRNKTHHAYKYYGARGITVCDEWLNDFQSFYDWSIANGYVPGLEIDRINNDKGYAPSNCRFTTCAEQSRNRNVCVLVMLNGVTRTVGEWAIIHGLKQSTVHGRLKRGWSIEESLNTPAGEKRNDTASP